MRAVHACFCELLSLIKLELSTLCWEHFVLRLFGSYFCFDMNTVSFSNVFKPL